MLVRLSLIRGESAPTLAVPRSAVLREGTHAVLFVQKPDGVFERRFVQTGRNDDLFVEITHGLQEAEPVAVQGAPDLQTAYASVR
jgi:multidrug efflux pump subunit AcrA (membrane-fusion protein)